MEVTMITREQYKQLFEKLGETGQLTPDELGELREYECFLTDQKYNREHTEEHRNNLA